MPKEAKVTATLDVIDHALVPHGHSPMYVMHKYWARKPHNVVAEYIRHHSKPGEMVLDPFVGSGVTALEAIKHGRKAIGLDLNPVAIFISEMTGRPADCEQIESTFRAIEASCRDEILNLYRTECSRCGRQATVLAGIWDRGKNALVEIRYSCQVCRKRLRKDPNRADRSLIRRIERGRIKYWYPKDKFPPGITFDQGRREAGERFSDLFTKRNLVALSILWNQITRIQPDDLRALFSFAFTSMVHLASKMTPVRPSRPFSSFWAINSYWVPPVYMESNVWMLFDSAVRGRQGLVTAKADSNSTIPSWKPAKTFADLEGGSNILLKAYNVLELAEILPDNSVDYVFTDPPYGGAVPYAELTTLWALWLGLKINYKDEITIDDEKNFAYYHKMLQAGFRQVFRVLKNGRYLTVTFHSTDIKVWNSIIKAVVLAGFDLEKIIYQPPARPSAKGLLVPYGSAVGDYYIRFRKPETAEAAITPSAVTPEQYEKAVVAAAIKILAERGEPTPYTYILNGIIVELKRAGVLLATGKNPDEVMRKHLGKDFVLIPVTDRLGKVVGQKWWFRDPSSVPHLQLVPLADRVEAAVVEVLNRNVKVSFDQVLQEVFLKFPNALTPETQKIQDLLQEYAEQTSDGKWALKPIVHTRQSEHTTMIAMLASLGRKAGYEISIGQKEQAEVFEGKKLSTLVTASPDLRSIPKGQADRIRQIDVIWHNGAQMRAVFEVENTTAITEAIVRCSNIKDSEVRRFVVLPEERERLLHRKLQEPLLAEHIKRNEWLFVFYRELKALWKRVERKKRITLRDVEKIATEPRSRDKIQMRLQF